MQSEIERKVFDQQHFRSPTAEVKPIEHVDFVTSFYAAQAYDAAMLINSGVGAVASIKMSSSVLIGTSIIPSRCI